jgi:hypothetical protein
MFTKSGTYPWSFVIQIFHSGQPSHGGDRTILDDVLSLNNSRFGDDELEIKYTIDTDMSASYLDLLLEIDSEEH